MNITIKTIPHNTQRYSTIGDYVFDENGDIHIFISNVGNWKEEALVALHELVEVLLCKDRGIAEPDIMAFDKAFEAARQPGNEDEPGDSPDAPYHREHTFAEGMERVFAEALGIKWSEYGNHLDAVYLPKR